MQYCFAYACINSYTIASKSRKNLVKIGQVVLELNGVKTKNCGTTLLKFGDSRSFGTLAF